MVACGGVVESRLQAAVRLRGPGMRLEALAIPDVNSGRIGLVRGIGHTSAWNRLLNMPFLTHPRKFRQDWRGGHEGEAP